MISLIQLGLLGVALVAQANAHLSLTHPLPLGSRPSTQGTAPCGGFAPSFDRTTEYYVGGEAVAFMTTHPQVHFLIRGTLDPTALGNWTNLFPVVRQYNIGGFCEPLVPAPAEWVGKDGIIQVIQSGEDGLQFQVSKRHRTCLKAPSNVSGQCAAVSFRAERAESVTTLCSNATGVTGEFSSDPKLPCDGAGFPVLCPTATETSGGATIASAPVAATTTPSSGSSMASWSVAIGALGACILSAALLS